MRPNPILKKMDDLYSELVEEVDSLERKKSQLEEVSRGLFIRVVLVRNA